MRVTPGTVNSQLILSLQQLLAAMAQRQNQLSSGQRILTPSDDPGAISQAMVVRSRQALTAQFTKNVAEARDALTSADQTLQSIQSTLARAKELAVQGASDNSDALARQSLGNEIDQLLEGLVSQANGRNSHGEFLFGGQESTQSPYTVTRDAAGHITAVTPNARGLDAAATVEVSDGVTIATGVSGTSVFGAAADRTNAFDVLIRLRDDLWANRSGVQQTLSLVADVDATGADIANAYRGIDQPTDLQIKGPSGTSYVRLTTSGDDTLSTVGRSASAIAVAAAINGASTTTGVSATVTPAVFAVADSASLFHDVNLGAGDLVINGQDIIANLNAGSGNEAVNRATLISAINAQSHLTGVVATASSTGLGFTLTAADGRNIAIKTSSAFGAGSPATEVLGYATHTLTTDRVVARGGVKLSANGAFTTAAVDVPAGQIQGAGDAGGISTALDALDAVINRAVIPQTLVGARLGWIGTLEERLNTQSVSQAQTLSSLDDLDIPKAVQELAQIKTAYQAALASGANIMQLSLLNYLK